MLTTAAVLDARNSPFRVEEVHLDDPGAGEVLVRIAATGVCHTDAVAQQGDLPFPPPGVLGHEGVGTAPVIRQTIDSVGMLGTAVLIGAAPAGAEFSADHLSTLWGKRIVGTLGGESQSARFVPALHDQGRLPFTDLIEYFPLEDINEALAASAGGRVVTPVLRMDL
jgi:aryl-alcohol dehydrogenase